MSSLSTAEQVTHLDVEQQLLHALKGIRYGSIEITVHDSQVVQIERKEKVRFDLSNAKK